MKACTRCGKEHNEVTKWCVTCKEVKSGYARTYREKYPAKERERKRKWERANPDMQSASVTRSHKKNYDKEMEYSRQRRELYPHKIKENNQRYYLRHREEINARNKQWRDANPERMQAIRDRWYKLNPEIKLLYTHNRRARIKGNGGELPIDVRRLLFDVQEGVCYLCGKLLYATFNDPITIEHKIPISRGGINDIDNVALAHRSCNSSKNNKTAEEYLAVQNAE